MADSILNGRDYYGKTPLDTATWRCCYEIVEMLLNKGADPNIAIDAELRHCHPPLHEAISHRRPDLVELPLEAGANTEARSYRGETPLLLGAYHQDMDIWRLLIQHGANGSALPADAKSMPAYMKCCEDMHPVIAFPSSAGELVDPSSVGEAQSLSV